MKLIRAQRSDALRGEIGAFLRLYNTPEPLCSELFRVLTYPNPDYETALRHSPWGVTRIPAEVCLVEDFVEFIQIPRGFDPDRLSQASRKQWNSIKWEDMRTSFPVKFPKCLLTLNEDQTRMARRFRKVIRKGMRPFGTQMYVAPTSAGKCLGRGTPVMLFNGTVVPVERVKVGDELMGPDGTPRTVLSLARGREPLYLVKQDHGGDDYVVNESHILSLRVCGGATKYNCSKSDRYLKGKIHNISVKEYLSESATFKHVTKGWRVAVSFETKKLPLEMPPYMLGLWLGDGHSNTSAITNTDPEVIQYIYNYAALNGLSVRRDGDNGIIYHLTTGNVGGRWGKNVFALRLRKLGLWNNKHIPLSYKINDETSRLELLAGILDADGSLSSHNYEVTLVNERLARDVCFVARTLGFCSSVTPVRKCCTNSKTKAVGTYYRVYIGGDLVRIPCRISRKRSKHRASRNATTTTIKLVPLGVGDYYGFEISGDRLFLLGDCTVTHNTIGQAYLASLTGERALILCKTNLIKRAWLEDMYKLFGMNEHDLGEIQQKKYRLGKHITLASIATLSRRKHLWAEIFSNIGCLVIDELHIIAANTIREIVSNCPAKHIIGMTATESRRDGKLFIVRDLMGPRVMKIANQQKETASSYPLADARIVQTMFRYVDKEGKQIDSEHFDLNDLTNRLIADEERNKLIIHEAKKDWLAGHSVVVVATRIEHIEKLLKLAHKEGIDEANMLTGVTNTNKFYTDRLMHALMTRKCRFLIASNAIKLGANINPLDRMHFALPPANKGDLEQYIGRIRRKHKSKKDAKIVYYHDIRTSYLHSRFKRVFFPVMRKLKVPRFANIYIA